MKTDGRCALRVPDAIPNLESLKNQLLWFDDVAAVWPDGEPTPITASQEATMKIVEELRKDDIFQPIYLEYQDLEKGTKAALDEAKKRLEIESTSPLWPITQPSALDVESGSGRMSEDDARRYLHSGKVPPKLTKLLVDAGLLKKNEWGDGEISGGFLADSYQTIDDLISTAAAAFNERQPVRMTLVPSNPSAVAHLAAPKRARRTVSAALKLPDLPAIRPDASIEQILELRSQRHYQDRRDEYLMTLEEIKKQWEHCDPELFTEMDQAAKFSEQLSLQIHQASKGLKASLESAKSVTGLSTLSGFLVTSAVAISAPSVLTVVQAGTAALGAVPLILRSRPYPFLRMAKDVLVMQ